VTGDKVDVARGQGAEIAGEVRRLLESFLRARATARLRPARACSNCRLPSCRRAGNGRSRPKRTAPSAIHARVNLARLDRGENLRAKIDYPVQTWTFGNSLAMVFLPG